MESTGAIWLMAGLAMLALMVLAVAARTVVTGVCGFNCSLASGLEAARLAHLAVGLLLRGLVSLLAR